MPIELRYQSSRGDVWRWYTLSWRRRLWRKHVVVVAAFALFALIVKPFSLNTLALNVVLALLACVAMAFYPQIAFKPSERWLKVGPGGLDTTIASKTGHRDWSELTIEEQGESVIISVNRTGNAFIVPARAFATERDRAAFLAATRAWATVSHPPSRSA